MSTDVTNLLQLYAGLPLFAFTIFLGWEACILMFLGAYYRYNRNCFRLTTTSFLRDALAKLNWPLWVSITTVLFLITNHLMVRGLAVGIWDVDGQYYP